MEQFDISFWIQMVVYAVSFGMFYGRVTTQISNLEKKVERHNTVVERTYKNENDISTAFERIDDLREKLKEEKKK